MPQETGCATAIHQYFPHYNPITQKARVGSHVRSYTVYHVLRDIPTIRLTEGVSKRIQEPLPWFLHQSKT